MTTRRRGRSAAVGVALLAVTGGLAVPALAAATTQAASRAHAKLVVLAGAQNYLAYAEYETTTSGQPNYARGTLHVLLANGTDRTLGPTPGTTAPLTPAGYRYSLVGSVLTDYSTADPTRVQWWDLSEGASGWGTLPLGATWQGSAPDGWVVVEADHTTLAVESPAGALTSYGQPIPDEVTRLGTIEAISGPNGVVSRGMDDGLLAYQTWLSPTTVVPLNDGQDTGSAAFTCASVSVAIVGCDDTGAAGAGTAKVAVPLDGTAVQTFSGCVAGDVAVEARLIYACGTPAHPRFAVSTGTVSRSSVKVIAAKGISAFGNFVTESPSQQQIVAIRTAHSPASVLVALGRRASPTLAQLDAASLRTAATAVETAALNSGALPAPPSTQLPAQVLLIASDALIAAARAADPSLTPKNTTAVMGAVPEHLRHPTKGHPPHRHVTASRSLRRFTHALPDRGAVGFGLNRLHDGAHPAKPQAADGVSVDPTLPALTAPTIGMVALRTAMAKLGQPYVWAAAGPTTFDCSGLVQWAYAHAGVWLTHFSGDQWNEGRKISPRDILPGDLILFDHRIGRREVIHHVALYLGADWMLNAPYTGQYVDVVPVPSSVAGVVRP